MAEKRKFKVLVELAQHSVGDTITEDEMVEDATLTEEVIDYMVRSQVVKPVKTASRSKGGSANGSR